MSLGFYSKMRVIQPGFAFLSSDNLRTFPVRILRLILALYTGMPNPTSGFAVLFRGDKILESYSLYQLSMQDYSVLRRGKDTRIVSMESRFNDLDSIRGEYLYSLSVGLHIVALIPIRRSFVNLMDEVVNLWIFVEIHRRVDIVWMSPSHVQRLRSGTPKVPSYGTKVPLYGTYLDGLRLRRVRELDH